MDDRSGDEVTDSEQEFERILDLDNIIKSITEQAIEATELHAKFLDFFSKIRELRDLIEYDSVDIKEIIDGMVAKELVFFSSYSSIVKLAEIGYFV
jgi:hypothetical protein